ncbi:MAG: aspartate aminotransferase family protein [Alphaproteobacteria bacterium]|nr:aspartate aminotransferase family protein [Alphaproteobacteria bacterium]
MNHAALLPAYRRSNITIARGEGAYLYGEDGTRYLDFATGIAVNALGHGHPHVVAALKEQADQLWHCSNMYRTAGLERFAERLTAACFADQVFFCNSGSEAVECAIKLARRFHYQNKCERYRIITMTGGFHGRTMACISAGGNQVAREGYAPLLDGFDAAQFNNISDVKQKITRETAAILLEPIQGEGGVNVATPEFLHALRALCDEHGLLLIFDEVQCGMGRSGRLFAHEYAGITPDILTAAKGIGNGFPLAACLMTKRVANCMSPGAHGSTYGANPLAMAVGNAVLDVMLADGFFEHVQRMGGLLKARLEGLAKRYPALIGEVRGTGLMLGLAMKVDHQAFAQKLREAGLFTAPAYGGVIRILPPLIIHESYVDEALAVLEKVSGAWA